MPKKRILQNCSKANMDVDPKGNFVDDPTKVRQTGDFPDIGKTEGNIWMGTNQIVGLVLHWFHSWTWWCQPCTDGFKHATPGCTADQTWSAHCWYRFGSVKAARDGASRSMQTGDGVVEFVDITKFMFVTNVMVAQLVSFEEDLVMHKLTKFVRTNQKHHQPPPRPLARSKL